MVVCLLLAVGLTPVFAAEPLEGLWQMIYQKLDDARTPPVPIAIRITKVTGGLQFKYLKGHELELLRTFTARPDGPEAKITDATGKEQGIATLTKVSATEYKLVMQSPFKPPEPGKLILTDGGMTLRSESDAIVPDAQAKGPQANGRIVHVVQVFARQTEEH